MNGPANAVLTVLHVVCSIVGFGAVAITGVEAIGARRSPPTPSSLRYFRPSINWASLSLLLTPFLGAGIEVVNNYPDVHLLWPWLALGIWIVAAAAGATLHWPAERAIQHLLAPGTRDPAEGPATAAAGGVPGPATIDAGAPAGAPAPAGATAHAELRAACLRASVSSAVMTLAFLAALAVMLIQPR